jgi:hypothetical protein
MTKLPRLNNLVWLAYLAADNADRVFQRYAWYGCVKQLLHKLQGFSLFFALVLKPPCAANSQVSAWRVGYHQVPVIVQYIKDIAFTVIAFSLGWQKVARHGIMALLRESIPDYSAKLTGN